MNDTLRTALRGAMLTAMAAALTLEATASAPSSTPEVQATLRFRPSDMHLRRGPAGPELVTAHTFPAHITVRPAIGDPWRPLVLNLDPIVATFAGRASVRSVDLDGDGDLDIVVARMGANGGSVAPDTTIVVFWERGRDALGAPVLEREYVVGPPTPSELQLADIDGDGVLDIVAATLTHQVWVARGAHGARGFTFEPAEPVGPQLAFPADLLVDDLDGDGLPEIVVTSRHFFSLGVWTLWNESTVGAPSFLHEQVTADLPLSTSLADLDGDGAPELTVSFGAAATRIYRSEGAAAAAARMLPPLEVAALTGAARIQSLHLDRDGRIDFLYTNIEGDRLQIALGHEWPTATRGPGIEIERASLIEVADLDGDGAPEVWYGSETSTELHVWRPFD